MWSNAGLISREKVLNHIEYKQTGMSKKQKERKAPMCRFHKCNRRYPN